MTSADGDELIPIDDPLAAFAARQAHAAATPSSRPEDILDRAAVRIFDAFTAAGVHAILLKGAALAQMLYAPHEHRRYIDIDILVAPHDTTRAGETLSRLDYRNTSADRGIDEIGGAVVHEALWLGQATDATYPLQVELHGWMPGARASPAVAWTALWEERIEMAIGSGRVTALGLPGLALQLATHAAQHGPGYAKGVYELALALARWPPDIWRQALALAERVEATDAFAVGLRLVPAGAELADRLGLPVSAALAWEAEHQHERPRGTFHLTALNDARGLSAKMLVLRRALVPDRRWVTYEHPWAARGALRLGLAYALHMLRAPLWAARAWHFSRSRRRA